MRNTFLFLLAMFLSTAVDAQEVKIDNARNSCSDYLKLKKEIDDVTQKILDDYERDYAFVSKFKKAQSTWESYRDAQLEMLFSADNKGIYGASYATCRCNALVDMTNERLGYLIRWISNADLGTACGGSINSQKRRSLSKLSE